MIYALYLKKKVYLSKKLYLISDDRKYRKEVRKNLDTNIRDFKSYGINFKNLNNKKNLKISKKFLGCSSLRSPEDLMILLGWNSLLKIYIAKFLSIIINLKENFLNGLNYSQKRRIGKDFK